MAEKDEMDLRQDNPGRAWYVIHTYSGYENKVKANLERLIHTANMGNMIFNVVVPVEDEVEIKDGKVAVTEADCPDKICVRHGPTDQTADPIVCLPHTLVVQVLAPAGGTEALDGVSS